MANRPSSDSVAAAPPGTPARFIVVCTGRGTHRRIELLRLALFFTGEGAPMLAQVASPQRGGQGRPHTELRSQVMQESSRGRRRIEVTCPDRNCRVRFVRQPEPLAALIAASSGVITVDASTRTMLG